MNTKSQIYRLLLSESIKIVSEEQINLNESEENEQLNSDENR